jgi:hypothetical protein
MASKTIYADAVISSGGWINTNNLLGSNSGTISTWSGSSTTSGVVEVRMSLPNIPSGSTINSVTLYIYSGQRQSSVATVVYKYRYNGSWCGSYHTDTITGTMGLDSSVCNHHTETVSGLNSTSNRLRMRAYMTGLDPDIFGFTQAKIAYFRITINYSTPTVPDAPADPTISATGIGQVQVSSSSPPDGGAALDNVEHQISTSSTFSSGNITWTKGSAPSNPQTHTFTGLSNGTVYYARARYHNSAGWGSYNSSPYNSISTWSVPGTANPTTSSLTSGIRITKNPTNPSDGGESIDYWKVYRSSTSGGTYTAISGNIAISNSTYDDYAPAGGETWYYKVSYINGIGEGSLSSAVSGVAGTVPSTDITKISDSRVKIIGQQIQKLSNSAIYRSAFDDKLKLSDVRIKNTYEVTTVLNSRIKTVMESSKSSDSRIKIITKTTELSDTRVKNTYETMKITDSKIKKFFETSTSSNSRIKVEAFTDITKTSDSRIKEIFSSTITSNTLLVNAREMYGLSNTRVKKIDQFTVSPSNSAILRVAFSEKNIVSDSDILISDILPYTSNSRVLKVSEVSRLSISTIFRPSYNNLIPTSDSRIVQGGVSLQNSKSDTVVKVVDNVSQKMSDTYVKLLLSREVQSVSTVFASAWGNISKTSNSDIFSTMKTSTTSDSDILINSSESKLSDTRVLHEGGYLHPLQTLKKPSNTILLKSSEIAMGHITDIRRTSIQEKISNVLIKLKTANLMLSDSVSKSSYKIQRFSNSKSLVESEVVKTSNSIMKKTLESSIPSDTFMERRPIIDILTDSVTKIPDNKIVKYSNMRVKNYDMNTKLSTVYIHGSVEISVSVDSVISTSGSMTFTSDTRTLITTKNFTTSTTAIRRDRGNLEAIFVKGREL